MTVRRPDSGLESVERQYETLAKVVAYVLLIPYVLSQQPTAGAFGITAGIAAAAGAWFTWSIILHPDWIERQPLMRAYMVVMGVLIALLTLRSPWYAFFT